MSIKACQNCRHADRDKDKGSGETFYWCLLFPPSPVNNGLPMMRPTGRCGQFKLALWRWLFGHGRS